MADEKRLMEMTKTEVDALVTMAVFKGVLGAIFFVGMLGSLLWYGGVVPR